jgi:hypothetical protein
MDVVVEEDGEQPNHAKIGHPLKQIGEIDPPESPRGMDEINKRLSDLFEGLTEWIHPMTQ